MRRRALLMPVAVLAAAVLAGPRAGAAEAATSEGIPHFSHVVILTEENEAAASTFAKGSPAVYLNSLRSKAVFLPNYYGTGHISLDNYIAMVSGQPPQPLTSTDCLEVSLWTCVQGQGVAAGGRNLADQLEARKLSWRSYQDGTPTPCFHGPYTPGDPEPDPYQGNSTTGAKNYADRHNPFIYFPDVIGNQARCAAHQRPFTELSADLRHNRLPAFTFITPDTCHDGHDNPCAGAKVGGLIAADAWLRAQLPALLSYLARHNGLLVVNFDEGMVPPPAQQVLTHPDDYSCRSCASLGLGGRTGALLVSPRLRGGVIVSTAYDHYSLLRTVEDSFEIHEHLGMAAQAVAMTDAFVAGKH